ncbi:MAG: lasso peptide biosynthesis B2 protein [Acidobacteria bacterium]|nr:lasso peptide biosynthesis B2 protein [Acidobacteriota bacterium]
MNRWKRRWIWLRRRSLTDFALAAEAMVALAVSRIAVVALKFKTYSAYLDSGAQDREPDPEVLRRVGRAVDIVANLVPWRAMCLESAVAAKWMLRRRGIRTTLHLGVALKDKFQAHAWLTHGQTTITGGRTGIDWTHLAAFGSEPGREQTQ